VARNVIVIDAVITATSTPAAHHPVQGSTDQQRAVTWRRAAAA
jgi:hypothetical protein